jgi:hypothetical protein
MKRLLLFCVISISAAVMLPLSQQALGGELFKCRTKDGEILYSDLACEKTGATRIGVVEPPPRPIDRNAASAASTSGAAKSEAKAGKKTPKDPEARRVREEELKILLEDASSTLEQKAAAQEEITSNASSGVCKLNEEERTARDNAFADLRGPRQGRAPARRALRQILSVCERV